MVEVEEGRVREERAQIIPLSSALCVHCEEKEQARVSNL